MSHKEKELFVLLELACGYFILHINEFDAIAANLNDVKLSLLEFGKFQRVAKLHAKHIFSNSEEALINCNALSCGESTEALRSFLEQNLPSKKKTYQLGVCDPGLGKNLSEHKFSIVFDKTIVEILRYCRFHASHFIKPLQNSDLEKFQIGLSHCHAQHKIRFDPKRQDRPVQNAITLIDNLNKMLNTFSMRLREWYSWSFPELNSLVTDNLKYAQCVQIIGMKEEVENKDISGLEAIVGESLTQEIRAALNGSMGQEVTQMDILNILHLAKEIVALFRQRDNMVDYLKRKLEFVAPNLQTLVGDTLAAMLITHAGSLTNLAKYPASTIQIVGAEKALFRALKAKTKTPKYGIIFQLSYVGKSEAKNKGKMSRYIANKCSLAARIDNFATIPSNIFGQKMKEQIEARMQYLTTGLKTQRNENVMKEALLEYNELVSQYALTMPTVLPHSIKDKKNNKKRTRDETKSIEPLSDEAIKKKSKKNKIDKESKDSTRIKKKKKIDA